jgi:oligopeptidase A
MVAENLRKCWHPAEVFESFRGRPPSTEALIRHTGLVAN